MSVLLLNGGAYKTISIVRSLGSKGIDVDVIGTSKSSMCFYSKYCRNSFVLKKGNRKKWFNGLISILKKRKYDLLIPQSERDCIYLSENKEKLPYDCLLLPPTSSIKKASSKRETMKIAKDLKIPIPKTYFVEDLKNLEEIKKKLNFPVIIKESEPSSIRPVYVFNEKNFIKKYIKTHKKSSYPIIQEVIRGPGYGTFALCKNGKVLQYFVHKRIREQDPKGSGSACCKSAELTPELKKYTDSLVDFLNWSGVVMFEFKKNVEDNNFKLIEINGRFWGSLPLDVHAGVDFPYQFYCLATGKRFKTIQNWKDVKARYFLGDLIRFFRILRGKPENWKLYFPSRFKAFEEILSRDKNCKYFVFDRKDIWPFFVDFFDRFLDFLKSSEKIEYKGLPILTYHNFYNSLNKETNDYRSISLKKFEEQLKYIRENNYETILINEIEENKNTEGKICLTFDDGYKSQYNAFKLLQKYNLKGNFFVISDKINEPGYLTDKQIKKMSSEEMLIGSHTKTHKNLTDISKRQINMELSKSKEEIEKIIKKDVNTISLPGGKYNYKVLFQILQNSYEKIRTSDINFSKFNKKLFPAITITDLSLLKDFKYLIKGFGVDLLKKIRNIKKIKKSGIPKQKTRGLFHLHSDYSYDGKFSIKELKDFCLDKDINFVFFTEHSQSLNHSKWKKYRKECEKYSDDNVVLIPGLEVSTKDGPHIFLIDPEKYFDSSFSKDVVEHAEKNNILYGIAHIHESNWSYLYDILGEKENIPILMEIWNMKYHYKSPPQKNLDSFRNLFYKEFPRPVFSIGGNDLHRLRNNNLIYIYLKGDVSYLQKKEIKKKIKKANFCSSLDRKYKLLPEGDWKGKYLVIAPGKIFRLVKSSSVARSFYHKFKKIKNSLIK